MRRRLPVHHRHILALGATVVITIDVVVDIATQTPIVNTATVTGNEPDPDLGNNSSTVITPVDYVDIELLKTVERPSWGHWAARATSLCWTME